MKKILLLFIVLLVPFFIFLEIWGVFQYQNLENEIRNLEQEQVQWLEQNKKILTGIAVYSSPDRLDELAQTELKLDQVDSGDVQKIIIDQGGGF